MDDHYVIAEPHDALIVARSLKENKLYCRVLEQKRSIDFLTSRIGASFRQDKLQVRIYMDGKMMERARRVCPDSDPLDLIHRTITFIQDYWHTKPRLIDSPIEIHTLVRSSDGLYGSIVLDYSPPKHIPKILRVVLMAEMMWCIDDALVELDLSDNVYHYLSDNAFR